jgi:hypothetical protein
MTPVPPPGLESADVPKTQVTWKDLTGVSPPRRVTYGNYFLSGPNIALKRVSPTSWKGTLRGFDVEFVAAPGKFTGPGTELSITFGEKNEVVVDGFWAGTAAHLVLESNKITALLPSGPMELTDMGSGMFNSYQGLLEIVGPSDMPQVVVSILAVLYP